AWVEQGYHQTVNSETRQPPLQRLATGVPFPLPTPAQPADAFLRADHRRVTKTATVSPHGTTYHAAPPLLGHRVELVSHPVDLTTIEIRLNGAPTGVAIPHRIGRHTHPKARPETPTPTPAPSGIDYMHLINATHQQHLAAQI